MHGCPPNTISRNVRVSRTVSAEERASAWTILMYRTQRASQPHRDVQGNSKYRYYQFTAATRDGLGHRALAGLHFKVSLREGLRKRKKTTTLFDAREKGCKSVGAQGGTARQLAMQN